MAVIQGHRPGATTLTVPSRSHSIDGPRPDWAWQDAASCLGEDLVLFYGPSDDAVREPARTKRARERRAKSICAGCPVRVACYAYALEHFEWGVWGGSTEDERKYIRRRNNRRQADGQVAS